MNSILYNTSKVSNIFLKKSLGVIVSVNQVKQVFSKITRYYYMSGLFAFESESFIRLVFVWLCEYKDYVISLKKVISLIFEFMLSF